MYDMIYKTSQYKYTMHCESTNYVLKKIRSFATSANYHLLNSLTYA